MLNSGLASPSFGSLAGERLPAMEERGFEESLSGFAPASTLTGGKMSPKWPVPASPSQPHSGA